MSEPWRVNFTAYDPGPLDHHAFIDLSRELRIVPALPEPDPVPVLVRGLQELSALVDRFVFDGVPFGFPLFYRAPRPALMPAPVRPALKPPSP